MVEEKQTENNNVKVETKTKNVVTAEEIPQDQKNTTLSRKAILDKKPVKRKVENDGTWGILYIYSSYNNTHLHVTDISGTETLGKVTGGMVTKSDRLKATPNIAMAAGKQIATICKEKGLTSLYIKLRAVGGHNGPTTPGPGAQAAIRILTRAGIKLGRIEDVTPIPHDSCRKKGGRRGRRV